MRTEKEYSQISSGEEVNLRGFLYRNTGGTWYLSEEPALKTCCVGAAHKANRQVILEGDFDPQWIQRVITVKGKWQGDESGYHLRESQLIQQESSFYSLLGVTVILLGLLWILRARFWRPKFPRPRS